MRRSQFTARLLALALIAATLAVASAGPVAATTTSVGDEAAYRAALDALSSDGSGPHTITITADIALDDGTDPTYTGTADLTINGDGHAINAGGTSRILDQQSDILLTVNDLTALAGSASSGDGGAILAVGPVVVADSTFSGNTAAANSGAIGSGTSVSVAASTFSGNTATTGVGGGVATFGFVSVTDSTFSGNHAGNNSGAIAAGGGASVTNSTLTGNSSDGWIGGIGSGEMVTLNHATVVGNSAPTESNVFASPFRSFGSVVAKPLGGGLNCSIGEGTTSDGFNWSDDDSCGFTGTGDIQDGTDALLGALRGNGGATGTVFPLSGSPLVDAIPVGSCAAAPLDVDQRGVGRPFPAGGACDIGAVEAVFGPHGFGDVSPFYESTVRWITSDVNTPNILDGYVDGTFRQKLNITRGQAARLYYRAAGEPDVSGLDPHGFSDVTAFFEDAVRWTKAEGIFDGFVDGTFRQADPITRGNYVRSLYGFAGSPDVSGLDPHGFVDVTAFYEDAVRWAKANGLVNGYAVDNTFRQKLNITRGDASRTAYNLAQTPAAWDDPDTAPPNMLFRPNSP